MGEQTENNIVESSNIPPVENAEKEPSFDYKSALNDVYTEAKYYGLEEDTSIEDFTDVLLRSKDFRNDLYKDVLFGSFDSREDYDEMIGKISSSYVENDPRGQLGFQNMNKDNASEMIQGFELPPEAEGGDMNLEVQETEQPQFELPQTERSQVDFEQGVIPLEPVTDDVLSEEAINEAERFEAQAKIIENTNTGYNIFDNEVRDIYSQTRATTEGWAGLANSFNGEADPYQEATLDQQTEDSFKESIGGMGESGFGFMSQDEAIKMAEGVDFGEPESVWKLGKKMNEAGFISKNNPFYKRAQMGSAEFKTKEEKRIKHNEKINTLITEKVDQVEKLKGKLSYLEEKGWLTPRDRELLGDVVLKSESELMSVSSTIAKRRSAGGDSEFYGLTAEQESIMKAQTKVDKRYESVSVKIDNLVGTDNMIKDFVSNGKGKQFFDEKKAAEKAELSEKEYFDTIVSRDPNDIIRYKNLTPQEKLREVFLRGVLPDITKTFRGYDESWTEELSEFLGDDPTLLRQLQEIGGDLSDQEKEEGYGDTKNAKDVADAVKTYLYFQTILKSGIDPSTLQERDVLDRGSNIVVGAVTSAGGGLLESTGFGQSELPIRPQDQLINIEGEDEYRNPFSMSNQIRNEFVKLDEMNAVMNRYGVDLDKQGGYGDKIEGLTKNLVQMGIELGSTGKIVGAAGKVKNIGRVEKALANVGRYYTKTDLAKHIATPIAMIEHVAQTSKNPLAKAFARMGKSSAEMGIAGVQRGALFYGTGATFKDENLDFSSGFWGSIGGDLVTRGLGSGVTKEGANFILKRIGAGLGEVGEETLDSYMADQEGFMRTMKDPNEIVFFLGSTFIMGTLMGNLDVGKKLSSFANNQYQYLSQEQKVNFDDITGRTELNREVKKLDKEVATDSETTTQNRKDLIGATADMSTDWKKVRDEIGVASLEETSKKLESEEIRTKEQAQDVYDKKVEEATEGIERKEVTHKDFKPGESPRPSKRIAEVPTYEAKLKEVPTDVPTKESFVSDIRSLEEEVSSASKVINEVESKLSTEEKKSKVKNSLEVNKEVEESFRKHKKEGKTTEESIDLAVNDVETKYDNKIDSKIDAVKHISKSSSKKINAENKKYGVTPMDKAVKLDLAQKEFAQEVNRITDWNKKEEARVTKQKEKRKKYINERIQKRAERKTAFDAKEAERLEAHNLKYDEAKLKAEEDYENEIAKAKGGVSEVPFISEQLKTQIEEKNRGLAMSGYDLMTTEEIVGLMKKPIDVSGNYNENMTDQERVDQVLEDARGTAYQDSNVRAEVEKIQDPEKTQRLKLKQMLS
jgi:hypothetical protein